MTSTDRAALIYSLTSSLQMAEWQLHETCGYSLIISIIFLGSVQTNWHAYQDIDWLPHSTISGRLPYLYCSSDLSCSHKRRMHALRTLEVHFKDHFMPRWLMTLVDLIGNIFRTCAPPQNASLRVQARTSLVQPGTGCTTRTWAGPFGKIGLMQGLSAGTSCPASPPPPPGSHWANDGRIINENSPCGVSRCVSRGHPVACFQMPG
jgi:hypothetical protein